MSLTTEICDDDNVNILENKDLYIHQYLTAIFQINLRKPTPTQNFSSLDDKAKVLCLNLPDVDNEYLSFGNYSHYVFENLMNQNIETVVQYVDKRFLSERGNLFTNSYRVFDDDSNKIAYLFNCYCRIEFVQDFANLIQAKQKLKRYIVDQAALLLACPYVNLRYSENTASTITPFTDLFDVLTHDILWPSEYLIYVKKFFVEITNAIHNAKNGISEVEDDYASALTDLSPEELNLEQVVKSIYDQLCKKFKDTHQLGPAFVDNIKFIHILIASPILAEIFIDLNSPLKLRSVDSSQANFSSQGNASPGNDLLRSFLVNTFNSLDLPLNTRDSSENLESFYQNSLLGILLCNSPLPSQFSKARDSQSRNFFLNFFQNSNFEYQFFQSPTTKTSSELERIELDIDDTLSKLRNCITELFFALLKSSANVRTKTLKWIECCLVTFNNRSKLWANELLSLVGGNNGNNLSDGFVLNFSAILLNLCKPFCSTPDNALSFGMPSHDNIIGVNQKMLKVDPTYISFAKAKSHSAPASDFQPYLQILNQESVLINFDSNRSTNNNNNDNQSNPEADKFKNYEPNFITRCFFSTHKALHLGFRVLHERFNGISQENSHIQRRLDTLGLTNILHYMNRDTLTPNQQEALQRLDHNMTVSLSMKSALIETSFINLLLEFYLATATWINNIAVCENETEAAQSFKKLEAILNGTLSINKNPPPKCLQWIPEFLIENIIDFMLFLRTFDVRPKILTLKSDLEPFLTMIVLFMGSQNRMRNPHLRAKLAEMLEALLPEIQGNIQNAYLESLFKKQFFIDELFPALLNVFVSIEISDETNNGDVVAFEQKFNYRRPMYVAFKHLCKLPDHQKTLASLATYAENNMDAVQSPIFLRFINLLINDAIYLLDEGLSLMAKLREAQIERDSGAWTQESQQQRSQNEANFSHLGRLAKFHNYIGRDTILTLTIITNYVKSFFSHRVLVDRMASMLNYFLHHLVGPNKQNFKVKQMNEYEFNPRDLVKNICRIYVNLACTNAQSVDVDVTYSPESPGLGKNEKYEDFCLAICQDDRSYSADLLSQAHEILVSKLSQPMLAEDIMSVDRTVKEVMLRQRKREIPLEDIPDDFLDPLLGTLMNDPVILPGSRKVLDRATISRHLLSDHTDPYTRSPLTMDMLIPDTKLKEKIEEFLTSKLKAMNQNNEA